MSNRTLSVTEDVNEDKVISVIQLNRGDYFELIETNLGGKYIYGSGKRFRYGFKVADEAIMLHQENDNLTVHNSDNSVDEIEIKDDNE